VQGEDEMRNFILIMVLSVVSGSAMAEWSEIQNNDLAIYYIDWSTVRTDGNIKKFWMLVDYKAPKTIGKISFMSIKLQEEIDCKEEKARTIYSIFFSQRLGNGESVTSLDAENWTPIVPGSITSVMFSGFCPKLAQ
jgi:hypothetical protein